jgi:dihydrodipicolinate synthase/N-acetylneuraminate lyase
VRRDGPGGDVYNRANARFTDETVGRLADECPNLVGFKDGVGDIEQMTRTYARMGDRLTYIGGLPTAEMFALPYLSLGLTTYAEIISAAGHEGIGFSYSKRAGGPGRALGASFS